MTTSERNILIKKLIRLTLAQSERLKVLSDATDVPQNALIRRYIESGLENEARK